MVPALAEKATDAPESGLPARSRTKATICVDPPPGDSRAGSARTVTVSTAADPMGSSSFSLIAPPENAVTCASPSGHRR